MRSTSGAPVNRAVDVKISHRGGGGARIGRFGAELALCWCYVTCGTGGAGCAIGRLSECAKSRQRAECEAVLAGGEGRVASLGALMGHRAARWARRQLACTRAALWAWGRAGGALGSWGSAFRILPDERATCTFEEPLMNSFVRTKPIEKMEIICRGSLPKASHHGCGFWNDPWCARNCH